MIQNHPLQDQQCLHPPINADHIYNTCTPPIHTTNTYHSSSGLLVHTNPSYYKVYTEPVPIPARVNTMMTNPCTLPRYRNSLFEPSKQHFADQPVESAPVIINAENDNLPAHFINHSDRDVVAPKHTYVGTLEKVQESGRDNLSTNATPEPVSQHALSGCLAHSDLLPSQRQSMHTPLQENSGVIRSSIADLSSTPLVQHYIDTGNAKHIKQGLNFLRLTKLKVDFETNTVETGSTLYPANTHYMQSSNSTIIISRPDVYRPCQLLLNKKACWMIALILTIVTTLSAVATHTHCHLSPPFKKQNKPFVSSEHNFTWKQLLTYGTIVRLKIRLQAPRPEKTGQLYFLDWMLPPVLAKRLHVSDHLAVNASERPRTPQNTNTIL